ncbi:MAG: nucleotide exchange factor GrpE, partial [Thermodesulfobacteriota bacterium]
LHDELQQYRNDMVRKQLLPVIMDVIKVADQVRKITGHFRSRDNAEIPPEKLLGALEAVPDDLEDLLSYQGVAAFRFEDAVFNPSRQQVLRKVETPDPALDKAVSESISPGYEWEGKVIRRELVNVYIHRAAAEEEAS